MANLTLWDIGAEWRLIMAEIVDQAGEITPDTAARLDAIGLSESSKIEAYYHVVAEFGHFAAAAKAEAAVLASKCRVAENAQARLKKFLLDYLVARGETEIHGTTHRAVIQANGGALAVEVLIPVDELPAEWTTMTITANLDAMRAAADERDDNIYNAAGVMVGRLVPRGTHLRFR